MSRPQLGGPAHEVLRPLYVLFDLIAAGHLRRGQHYGAGHFISSFPRAAAA